MSVYRKEISDVKFCELYAIEDYNHNPIRSDCFGYHPLSFGSFEFECEQSLIAMIQSAVISQQIILLERLSPVHQPQLLVHLTRRHIFPSRLY